MQRRTFFRVMLDIIFNNAIFKTMAACVNFCNEIWYFNRKKLKFLGKMPIINIAKENYYKKRFVFNSITSNRNNLK